MKNTAPQKVRGSIPWGWLVTIVIVAVAVGLAIVFFPKPAAKTQPPPVVRAKVPPMPPVTTPAPEPATGQQQSTPEEMLRTDGNATTLQGKLTTAQESVEETAAAVVQSTDATAKTPTEITVDQGKPEGSAKATPKESPPPTPAAAKPMERALGTPAKSDEAAAAPNTTPAETAEGEQKEAQKTSEPKAVEQPQPKPQGFAIQVGAYRNKAYAETQMADMQQRGYSAYIYEVTDAQQRSFYMVRFGEFATRGEAAETVADFKEEEEMSAVIVRAGSM